MKNRFRAFISYSHSDEHIAAWLQRKLEGYRVPRRLRAERPTLPARLNPIFRDREELASGEDLGEEIRSALARSEALLVICSPAAAASRWVNEEIRTFREQSPGRPVLCLIVSGSPTPGDDCAFPPALLQSAAGEPLAEPLAADIRDSADGKRGALLKIIAGLLDVGVDALRRRDYQRRIRFLGSVAAGAGAIAVVTILLAFSAVKSRNEAEIRRALAEELIDFMLVELRSKLEPIGKLHLLDSVGHQAMDYFAALGDLGTDKELLGRALALRQIGDVRFNQGSLEAALAAFLESRKMTSKLLASKVEDDEVLFEHSQAEFWVGYVAWKRKDLEGASRALHAYHAASVELAGRNPAPRYKRELVYSVGNLGALARERGQLAVALTHFEEAVTRGRELLLSTPDDASLQYDISEGLSFKGSTLLEMGELKQGEAALQEAFDTVAHLHGKKIDTRYSASYGDIATVLGDIQAHQGNTAVALNTYQSGASVFGDLVAEDADNAAWHEGYYRSFFVLGELELHTGDLDKAESQLDIATSGFTSLLDRDPSNFELRDRLALSEAYQAQVLVRRGELPAALLQADLARQRVAALIDQDKVTAGNVRRIVRVLDLFGAVAAVNGQAEKAGNAWQSALSLLGTTGDGTILDKALQARLLYQLGDRDVALKHHRELQKMGFQDPRYLVAGLQN